MTYAKIRDQKGENSFDSPLVEGIGGLLYRLGTGADEIEAASLERLSQSDWDEIIRQAGRHGITPLIYHRFRSGGMSARIPTEVVQRLRKVYLYSVEKNMLLYHELSKVLRALHNDDISIIVLKGAALAELVYQNIALRPMVDVDLLIKGEDISKIDKVLFQLGYESEAAPMFFLSKRQINWYIQRTQHIKYVNGVINIELHPRIYELPNINPWINASPVKLASIDAFVLCPEDLLLHLCLHVDRHLRSNGWTMLIWWYDITKVLERYRKEFNWDLMIGVAREHQVEEPVHRVLRVIDKWFGEHIPAYLFSQLKDGDTMISINDVLHPVVESEIERDQNRELDSFLLSISRIPSIHNKIYFLFRSILPCRESMIRRYSIARRNRVYFYYFLRMGKLAVKAVKTLHKLPGYLRYRHSSG